MEWRATWKACLACDPLKLKFVHLLIWSLTFHFWIIHLFFYHWTIQISQCCQMLLFTFHSQRNCLCLSYNTSNVLLSLALFRQSLLEFLTVQTVCNIHLWSHISVAFEFFLKWSSTFQNSLRSGTNNPKIWLFGLIKGKERHLVTSERYDQSLYQQTEEQTKMLLYFDSAAVLSTQIDIYWD